MNPKYLAGMLAGCGGLVGVACWSAIHFDQARPLEENSPSAVKLASLRQPLASTVFAISDQELLWQRAFDSIESEQQNESMNKLLRDWASQSPLDAAHAVQAMPAGILRDKAIRILAQIWGGQDPDEALTWSAKLMDRSERQMFLTNVCLGLAQRSPSAALQLAYENHDEEAGLLENLTQQWAEMETPAALSWATQLPPSQARDRFLQRIALVESKTNPIQAAGLVVQQISPGSEQTEAVITIVHQWAERDWNGAAAWVEQFPEGAIRDRAVTELNGMAQ